MAYAREEALTLYYSGETPKKICRKFKIEQKLLNYWIKDDTRRKALDLYLLGMKETKICKELNVYIEELNGWIKNMNDIIKQKRKNIEKNSQVKANKTNPTKTNWVNSICSDYRKEVEAKAQAVAKSINRLLKSAKTPSNEVLKYYEQGCPSKMEDY